MLDAKDLARAILDVIRDQESLGKASRRAQVRVEGKGWAERSVCTQELALSWDEDKYAQRLIEVLEDPKVIAGS
eukprot:761718-Hanusia_phi.AAC.2